MKRTRRLASVLATGCIAVFVSIALGGGLTACGGATIRLRLDAAPSQLEVAGGAMVFTLGPSVYRVPLE